MIITLTEKQLEGYTPPPNKVLIAPSRSNDEMIIYNQHTGEQAMKVFIDSSFEPEKNAAITGVVIKTPTHLIYDEDDFDRSLDWDTDMQLRSGDNVIYNFLQVVKAFKKNDEKYIVVKNENDEIVNICILVKYDNIYVATREIGDGLDTETIVLNGFVIAEPVQLPSEVGGFRLPEKEDSQDKFKAIVRYIGSPVRRFLIPEKRDPKLPADIIGKTVFVDKNRFVPLEYSTHRSFADKKKYWRFQRAAIIGIE